MLARHEPGTLEIYRFPLDPKIVFQCGRRHRLGPNVVTSPFYKNPFVIAPNDTRL
jgi:hypothetical protein